MFGQDYMNPMQRYMNPMMQNPIPPMPTMNLSQSQFVAKQVGNIEEAKAHLTDGLSTYLFVDYNAGKIYLKRLGNNGLSEFYTFSAEQNQTVNQRKDPLVEINERLEKIENYLGGKQNAKPDVNDATADNEPNATVQPSVVFQGNANAQR